MAGLWQDSNSVKARKKIAQNNANNARQESLGNMAKAGQLWQDIDDSTATTRQLWQDNRESRRFFSLVLRQMQTILFKNDFLIE